MYDSHTNDNNVGLDVTCGLDVVFQGRRGWSSVHGQAHAKTLHSPELWISDDVEHQPASQEL